MSAKTGDKARHNRLKKRHTLRRVTARKLRAEAVKPAAAPAPAAS
jgi:hypothetical protein